MWRVSGRYSPVAPFMGDVNVGYLVKVRFSRLLQGGGALSPFNVVRDLLSGVLRLCDYPVPQQSFTHCFGVQRRFFVDGKSQCLCFFIHD